VSATHSYLTVLDIYVLGCFGFLSVVTVYHSSFPSIYGVRVEDSSPLSLPPNAARVDELDFVDWDVWYVPTMHNFGIPQRTNAKALPAKRPIMRAMPNRAHQRSQVQLVPAQAFDISSSIAYSYEPFSSRKHPKASIISKLTSGQ
jgi:hypothetical protein